MVSTSSIAATAISMSMSALLLGSLLAPTLIAGWVAVVPSSTYRSSSSSSSLHMATGKGKRAQQRKIDDFVDFMEAPPGNDGHFEVEDAYTGDDAGPNADSLAPLVRCIVRAADMRKAEDIRAIRVSKLTATTSFVVVVSGNSRPQNQAIAASVQSSVSDFESRDKRTKGNGVPEGSADSGWILLDYGDVMVHVMTPKSRLFYDIEGKWEKGEDMDLRELLVPNSMSGAADLENNGAAAGLGGGMANLDEEDDPFWS